MDGLLSINGDKYVEFLAKLEKLNHDLFEN